MISTARSATRPIRIPDRRVLVGGVLAVVILVSIVAALVGRLVASPDTTVAPARVGDLAAFSPSIVGDASLLDASTAGFLPSGSSDWFAGDQSREMSLTEPGMPAVRMAVGDLATFSPSIVGDASRSGVPSVALPTGYSEWMGGDQSRERVGHWSQA